MDSEGEQSSASSSILASPESIFLRIYLPKDNVLSWITLQIPSKDTLLQEVLELACQRVRVSAPIAEYALLLALQSIVSHSSVGDQLTATIIAPLRKAVGTLPHTLDGLALVRKGSDPSLSYPPRSPSVDKGYINGVDDYAAVYKKYTVHKYENAPRLAPFRSDTRKERALIIRGDQIQISAATKPSTGNGGIFGTNKVVPEAPESYSLRNILISKSSEDASAFRITVLQVRDDTPQSTPLPASRRIYEFEAAHPKSVVELVQTIKTLQLLWGAMSKDTGNKKDRSRMSQNSFSTTSTLVGNY